MHVLSSDQIAFTFRPDVPPALRVRPGETVRFETSTAPVERLFAAGDRWLELVDPTVINAVTGPVFIEGVEPGDAVSVDILAIDTLDWAWTSVTPGFGLLTEPDISPSLSRLAIRDGQVILSERLSVPIRPMIGCLGLAPASGESSTLSPPFPWGGNYDLGQVAPGTTVLLPAQVPGGLFSLGDLHAAMGDGEANSIAIECAGFATVRLGVRKGLRMDTPRLETGDRIFTVGLSARGDYTSARRQAVTLLYRYLTAERGLTPTDAHALISAAADLAFGGPATAVVLASVPLNVFGPMAEDHSSPLLRPEHRRTATGAHG